MITTSGIAPYILGMCLTHVPGDPVLSVALCRMAWEAQQRVIVVSDDWSDEKREQFYQDVQNLVYP